MHTSTLQVLFLIVFYKSSFLMLTHPRHSYLAVKPRLARPRVSSMVQTSDHLQRFLHRCLFGMSIQVFFGIPLSLGQRISLCGEQLQ